MVNGFARVGAGNLAFPVLNDQVSTIVDETVHLASFFPETGLPVLVFLDNDEPGKPELPHLLHCEVRSGEEELLPKLKWLDNEEKTTLVPRTE